MSIDDVTVKAWFIDGELIIRVSSNDSSTIIIRNTSSIEDYPDYVRLVIGLVRDVARLIIPLRSELARIADNAIHYTDEYP